MSRRFACPNCSQTCVTSSPIAPRRCPRCGYAGSLAVQADERDRSAEDATGNRPPAFRSTRDITTLCSGAYSLPTLLGDSIDSERALFHDAKQQLRRLDEALLRLRATPRPSFWAAGALSMLAFVAAGLVAQFAAESSADESRWPGAIALGGLGLAALPILRVRRRRTAHSQRLDNAADEFDDRMHAYGAAAKKYVAAAQGVLRQRLPGGSGGLTLALLSIEEMRWVAYNQQMILRLDFLEDAGVYLQRSDWRDVRLESHDERRVATSTATTSSRQKEALWGALIGDALLGRGGATAGAVIGAAGERSTTTESRETTVQRWVVDVYTRVASAPVLSCDFGRREEQAKEFYGCVARELELARYRDL